MIDKLALIFVIIGALNWGLVGLFGLDAIAFLFGGQAVLASRAVYTVVAMAGIWSVSLLFRETQEHRA